MNSAPQRCETRLAGRVIVNETADAIFKIAKKADNKHFSTLQAKFALTGHELHRVESPDGGLFISRWGLTRELRDLEDAEAFLALLIGGAQ